MGSPYREGAGTRQPKGSRGKGGEGPLAVVDASGRAGKDGPNGSAGGDGNSRGGDGGDGESAGPAEAGRPGGTIDVMLSDDAGAIAIRGTTKRRAREEDVSERIEIGDAGLVRFVAYGGTGGAGGAGGAGGDGARGTSGSDATRYSTGGDGGRGGDGGNGGDGTSGAEGGAGGKVVVRALRADMHLFMLVDVAVGGGRGGTAGTNGAAGRGGSGGPGGSSYSWTETETYTDSNGQTQTRSTSHSKSGGSSGSSGSAGRAGRGHLRAGNAGPPGVLRLGIDRGTKVVFHSSRYDLRLTALVHTDENEDGVYEPEERVRVTGITVTNVGGMPTPETRDVRIALVDDGWIAPEEPTSLVVPPGLAEGASHTFSEALSFRLRLFRPQEPGEPLLLTERVHFVAWVPDARRRFEAFEADLDPTRPEIVVRFPARLSALTAPFALAPGERARVDFAVENVSKHALGSAAPRPRALATRVRIEGDAQAMLASPEESPLTELAPDATAHGSAIVELPVESTEYSSTLVTVELGLGSVDVPAIPRPIQLRAFTIRTVTPYASKKVDVVLVVGNRSSREEIDAWRGLASSLGLTVAVYDVTMEQTIDEARLAADAADGAIIILNDLVDGPGGASHLSSRLTPGGLATIGEAKARLTITGHVPELAPLLFPASAVADDTSRALTVGLGTVPGIETAVSPSAWTILPWGKPKRKTIEARAKRLQALLDRSRPHERWSVRWTFVPALERTFLLWNRHKLGTLRIVRGADVGTLLGLPMTTAVLHDASGLASHTGLFALASALPDALLVARYLASDEGSASVVRSALVARLVAQISTAVRAGHASPEALPTLLTLVERSSSIKEDERGGERLLDLLAEVRAWATSLVRLWEWIPPLPWLRTRPRLRRIALALVDDAAARAGLPADAVAHRAKATPTQGTFEEREARLIAVLPLELREEHGAEEARLLGAKEAKALEAHWRTREVALANDAELAKKTRASLLQPPTR